MSLNDCPHRGAGHGRFSIVTKPCATCGRQRVLRGCLTAGAGSPVDILRETQPFRYRCECGAEFSSLLPAFVDHLDIRVIGPPSAVGPPSDASRPAA